jgi:hypothetical protein
MTEANSTTAWPCGELERATIGQAGHCRDGLPDITRQMAWTCSARP